MGALSETLWKFRKHFIQVGFTYMEELSFRNQQQPFWHFHSMELEIGAMPTLEGRFISSKSHPKTTSNMAKSREGFWPQRNGKPHGCRWVISYLPSPVAPGVPGAREAWEEKEATWNITQSVEPYCFDTSKTDNWWKVGGTRPSWKTHTQRYYVLFL